MTPAQLQTIKDALDSERQYWTTIASDPKDVIDSEIAKIDDAKAALCALVDSVRWRKQSEEPASSEFVLARNSFDGRGGPKCNPLLVGGSLLSPETEWLPVPP